MYKSKFDFLGNWRSQSNRYGDQKPSNTWEMGAVTNSSDLLPLPVYKNEEKPLKHRDTMWENLRLSTCPSHIGKES